MNCPTHLTALANLRHRPAVFVGVGVGVGLLILVEGLPQWATDWLARPVFMEGCTLGSRLDDATLRQCTVAYERYRAVAANGWRPLSE